MFVYLTKRDYPEQDSESSSGQAVSSILYTDISTLNISNQTHVIMNIYDLTYNGMDVIMKEKVSLRDIKAYYMSLELVKCWPRVHVIDLSDSSNYKVIMEKLVAFKFDKARIPEYFYNLNVLAEMLCDEKLEILPQYIMMREKTGEIVFIGDYSIHKYTTYHTWEPDKKLNMNRSLALCMFNYECATQIAQWGKEMLDEMKSLFKDKNKMPLFFKEFGLDYDLYTKPIDLDILSYIWDAFYIIKYISMYFMISFGKVDTDISPSVYNTAIENARKGIRHVTSFDFLVLVIKRVDYKFDDGIVSMHLKEIIKKAEKTQL